MLTFDDRLANMLRAGFTSEADEYNEKLQKQEDEEAPQESED